MQNKKISIVIPAYNEEKNIENVISDSLEVLSDISNDYEILIVNDGSSDKTGEILNSISSENPRIKVYHHKVNKGVGTALYACYSKSAGDLIFLLPGDNQVKTYELYKMLPLMEENDIVVGNRKNRADPFLRSLSSRLYNKFVKILFGLNVNDVHSIKLYRKEVFEKINIDSRSAFIEVEILAKAKMKGYKITQIDIAHFPRKFGKQTGNKPIVIIKEFLELFKFWWALRHETR